MLVLTRKASEEILIGDDIKITLVRVRGNSVRIGIEAPRDIRVVRAEIDSPKQQAQPDDVSVADRPGIDWEDQEAVFAHPQRKRPVRKPRKQRVENRLQMHEPSSAAVNRQVVVGKSSADGRVMRLRSDLVSPNAPLSSFISAT